MAFEHEKPQLGSLDTKPKAQARRSSHSSRAALKLTALVGLVYLITAKFGWGCNRKSSYVHERVLSAEPDFDWNQLLPSETLEWVPCYEKFQCTRLEVPLDYAKPHAAKAAVAVIKYPSKFAVGENGWRGPILYNPGGPGGSGVAIILRDGEKFSKIIGDDYDHVGFDPRGIGRTTPQLNVLGGAAERKTWDLLSPPPINFTSDALAKKYAGSQVLGNLAIERGKQTAEHMSTAVVARDMLQITEAHGRDKILYWGFSYGTVLGITYAAMFPNNIERLIVDGVVDTYNYYSTDWDNNLIDTDKGLNMAIESCASSSECALHEKTPELVRKRLDAVFNSLKAKPLPVINGSNYGVADWVMAREVLFLSLYKPSPLFPQVMKAFADVEKGDGRGLFNVSNTIDSLFRCECSASASVIPMVRRETTFAVACGEGNIVDKSLSEVAEHYARMAQLSSFADVWEIHAMCSGWKIRAAEIFNGPFVGNTSFPIMLIGNVADPVTPLWAAKKMSQGFKDAAVLTQNSPGHCSLAQASLCTSKHIRAYFRDGVLPPKDTVCDVDEPIFKPDGADVSSNFLNTLSEEDARLYQAAKELSRDFTVPSLGSNVFF